MRQEDTHKKITDFLNGTGPPRLFFFYRCPYERVKDSKETRTISSDKELVVNFGESEILQDKTVYFVRTTGSKPVNMAVETDPEVIAGEIPAAAVNVLEVLLNSVLIPMIDNLQAQEWGVCEEEHKKEFLTHTKKFSQDLHEAIDTLSGVVELQKLDPKFENEARVTSKQPSEECTNHCRNLVASWIHTIDKYVKECDEAEERKIEPTEEGPLTELENWRQTQRILTGLSEQIKGPGCTTVLNLLHAAKLSSSSDKDSITSLLSSWKKKESDLTEKLNEAKDNVKYLRTLEPYMEPLYSGKPTLIIESMRGLMHAIKMMFSIAKHYDKGSRMTILFSKITYQMISSCIQAITQGRPASELWDTAKFPVGPLTKVLESCIRLNAEYKKEFNDIKQRLNANPKGKHYEFTDTAIFGKFDLFCRRVGKLKDLFETIEQFQVLERHNLENMTTIISEFQETLGTLKKNNLDKLLDYKKNDFDIDFVSFNAYVSQTESKLMQFVSEKVSQVKSIEQSIRFLEKFKTILKRDNLKKELEQKSSVLFSTYQQSFRDIEASYEKDSNNPPLVRNMPEHAGKIMWLNHLYDKVARPLREFDASVRQSKENKKCVENAWRFMKKIGLHKLLIHEKWEKRVETSKAALQATLLTGGGDKAWQVNFETEIMTLIREAKCMSRMGMKLNENAKIILLQEEKFKTYYNELDYLIKEYNRISEKIRSNTRDILKPHLEDLETRLRPGSITLTWTSMNIDGYLQHVHEGLRKLEQFIIKINDVMDNRIENNLKEVSKTELVDLSVGGKAFTLDEFVERQERCIKEKSKGLKAKNMEVEQAVSDLRKAILAYERDPHVGQVSYEEMRKIIKYYYWSMYQALLHATKHSLNALKERVCERKKDSKEPMMKPFFEVKVQLENGSCVLNPPLSDIQSSINRAANAILKSTKNVTKWIKGTNQTFYEWVAKDKEIVKVILLLTGSIEGTKNKVEGFLAQFVKFEWLWKLDIVKTQQEVSARATSNEDYEEELKKLKKTEIEINEISKSTQIGAMELKTDKIQESMLKILRAWKKEYLSDLTKKVKNRVDGLKDEIKRLFVRAKRPVKDLATLGEVMQTLDDIRDKESEIKIQLKPVSEIYNLLDVYLKGVQDKEEENQKKVLEQEWKKLVIEAENRRTRLQQEQTEYKRELINNIRSLMEEAKEFCREFKEKGPNVPGISPGEALDRLKSFKSKHDEVLKRKRENCERGEKIFNLTHKKYEELDQTDKEMQWLLKLYQLYASVLADIMQWKEISWVDVPRQLEDMSKSIKEYDRKCLNLDEQLKKIPAYKELKVDVDNFIRTLPLIEMMSKPSILPRHWETDLALKIKTPIKFVRETFTLGNFLDMNLIPYTEEVKEISKAADEQLSIENQLQEIEEHWKIEEFLLTTTARKKDTPCALDSKKIEEIINKLEEHQTRINTMTAWRSSTPHQDKLAAASNKYSEIYDTINKWMKVQKIWQFLEPVFHTQDIAKQMIQESKRFAQIEKDWTKIIEKVVEEKNVVRCCENDMLKGLLSTLEESLEFCQKKLDTYLEKKRREFPRFYFVSDTEVLNILSQGSDPAAVQYHLASLFDGITNIEFDSADKKYISKIMCVYNENSKEELKLCNPVRVEQQKIEDWLQTLEDEMKRTVKKTIGEAISEFGQLPPQAIEKNTPALIKKYPTQICQVILRAMWTSDVEQGRAETPIKRQNKDMVQTIMSGIVNTLKEMLKEPSEDPNDVLTKLKLEGLITIQVYQAEAYNKIIGGDFELEKQKTVRMAWTGEPKELEVKIADFEFKYFYEFLKATEKLVITPLTDRCYISMAQALQLQCGGCAFGPPGVGKTETIKDMGRTLGVLVVVTNCSEQHNTASLAKMLKGVVSTGTWGNFDQFSQIARDVLSVIAGHIEAIANVKRIGASKFVYPGEGQDLGETKHVPTSAYFITLGHRTSTELPDNVKVQFRQVAMMQPDHKVIIDVKLNAMGFVNHEKLAEKFTTLYTLCQAQLSKQKHYDFGLRNITPVFLAVENAKQGEVDDKDYEKLLVRAIKETNIPKLVGPDVNIFLGLLKDIFADSFDSEPSKDNTSLEAVIDDQLAKYRLSEGKAWRSKIIQLHNIAQVRHGIMVVGPTGSGKSTMIQQLQESLQVHKGVQYKTHRINPKAMSPEDFYGAKSESSKDKEWVDGVFTKIWEKCNKRNLKQNTWIILDGPLDSSWVENLNSVLDDNKMLTLANGQRIPMTDNVKLIFEIEQLNHAEPSTISRCGILFLSLEDLGWQTLIRSYLRARAEQRTACNPNEMEIILEFVKSYIEDTNIMEALDKDYAPSMQTNNAVRATSFITILNSLLKQHTTLDKQSYEQLFVFSLAWALGGLLEVERKDHFQKFLIDKMGSIKQLLPHKVVYEKDSIFDYSLEKEGGGVAWKPFAVTRIEAPTQLNYSELFVPTLDSARAEYLIEQIGTLNNPIDVGQKAVLIVGGTGTAKTSSMLVYANKKREKLFKMLTFSALTTPQILHDGITSELTRKRARNFEPEGDKIMMTFFDDMSMPMPNAWGYQPTLELVRQLLEQSGMYFLTPEQRGDFMNLARLQYVGAMADPGAGWRDIPNRLKRLFFSFNMSMPTQQGLESIFGLIMRSQFTEKYFEGPTIKVACSLVEATTMLRNRVAKTLYPSPATFHYRFSMREVARVFQGILEANADPEMKIIQNGKEGINSHQYLILLWRHECMRAFHDKLVNHYDRQAFMDVLDGVTLEKYREVLPEEESIWKHEWLFCNFLRKPKKDSSGEIIEPAPKVYEAVDFNEGLQKLCMEKLEEYNETQERKVLDLVLFEDAIKNLLKITRVLQLKRGSALLIGTGGSGKQSLTRLAVHIQGQEFSYVNTNTNEKFLETMKELFNNLVGENAVPTTVLLPEGDIKTDILYEHVNSFLATGEITGMITKDDKDKLFLNNKDILVKEVAAGSGDQSKRAVYRHAVKNVRDRLHIILSMSPSARHFAQKHRNFPAIFSHCNLIWFLPWSEESLANVAHSMFTGFKIDCPPAVVNNLSAHAAALHVGMQEECKKYYERMKRYVYITPRTYLSFINNFGQEYARRILQQHEYESKVKVGVDKMEEAAVGLEKIKQEANKEIMKQNEAKENVEKLLKELTEFQSITTRETEKVEKKTEECKKQEEQITKEQERLDVDLAKALPALNDALKSAQALTPQVLNEVKTLQKGTLDVTRLIVDCLLILFQKSVSNTSWTEYERAKGDKYPFMKDSFEEQGRAFLTAPNLQKKLLDFINNEKDTINDETCELLEPYLNLTRLNEDQIAKASPMLNYLLEIVKGMYNYHNASKHLKGRLADLTKMRESYAIEKEKLAKAEETLKDGVAKLEERRKQFTKKNEEKEVINQQVKNLNIRYTNLNKLINELQEDKKIWAEDAAQFNEKKLKIIGDVCLTSAFINYCGPFNFEFRQHIYKDLFKADLAQKDVPCTPTLEVVPFLADKATIGQWRMEGLPNDRNTIQNALLMTLAPRFPLLIDPQGQAVAWIKKRERNIEGKSSEMPKLMEDSGALVKAMENGESYLIENMGTKLPSVLEQVLDAPCGKFKKRAIKVLFNNAETQVDENFMLYMTTKLANPHFAPELASRVAIIDFTMSQEAIQSTLLAKVIPRELRSAAEQLNIHTNSVTMYKSLLQEIGEHVLTTISSTQGSLLDSDTEVEELNKQKKKSAETLRKLKESKEKKRDLKKRRELYRGVARRGAALYLALLDMANVNWMYNTSLQQFMRIFENALCTAKKASTAKERSDNISNLVTEMVFRYMNRALYTKDKALFALSLGLRIKLLDGVIKPQDLTFFLKAGTMAEERQKSPLGWLDEGEFMRLRMLSKHKFGTETTAFFKDIFDKIQANEEAWKAWKAEIAPESKPIPDYNEKLASEKDLGPFMTLCLIRCIREDRTIMAAYKFVSDHSVLGPKYENPPVDTLEEVYADSTSKIPILYLLSSLCDPTTGIEELCRKKLKKAPIKIALGEGQENVKAMIEAAMAPANLNTVTWVILQNCHFGLKHMSGIMELFTGKGYNIRDEFRLFMTTEATNSFPLGLLHSTIKVTNDPPKGLLPGMLRTLTQVVSSDRLDKLDAVEKWKNVVLTVSFMHNILLERRKYGPIGFSHPYEFSNADLDTCLTSLEKLSPTGNFEESKWKMAKFMVCEIQYGGKMTDERDRELLGTYGEDFFKTEILKGDIYELVTKTKYTIPKVEGSDVHVIKEEIARTWPATDEPTTFGLSNLADKAYRARESKDLLSSLLEVLPKDHAAQNGKPRDLEVREKLEKEIKPKLPPALKDIEKKERKIMTPIFMFFGQEIRRFQNVYITIIKAIQEILMAIDGQIIMTPELDEAIQSLYNGKVPHTWVYDPLGSEWSWISSSTTHWFKELSQRYNQLNTWSRTDRLGSYWLGGFFNPQGFLFAVKQEECRRKKDREMTTLDGYELYSEVQSSQQWADVEKFDYKVTQVRNKDKDKDEFSVLVHGLYIEGAVYGSSKGLEDCKTDILNLLQIVKITAKKRPDEPKAGYPGKAYYCPVYRYPSRGEKNLITKFKFEPGTKDADYWRKKGVAVLCSKEYVYQATQRILTTHHHLEKLHLIITMVIYASRVNLCLLQRCYQF
eukprot:TRINITY_DN105183_c0_g1_i1.p1 TRINITY_DN105183_c0_g1~~TRINITY_DN105183_c0_g1_i1.p1  ORF type:complete len:4616 (+),score=767.18 TRINITY_DN105183_c0_g1_i1:15469-29316(+)